MQCCTATTQVATTIGIDLGREDVPDATTLLKFRRLLERHDLAAAILAEVKAHLSERGLLMRQAKKGNPWHHGVDAGSGLIHSVVCTAANEADVVPAHELLQGLESQVHGDSGYTGLAKREEIKAAQDAGRLRKDIDWRIAIKRGQIQAMPEGPAKALYAWFERRTAQVRAIVEHPFHVIRTLIGYRKRSCRGIAKNEARARARAALTNLSSPGAD